jgi:shikimate dehydrogenase
VFKQSTNVATYAVVGNPVAHSKSPLIHSLFAKQTGQDLEYTTQQCDDSSFDQTVLDFFSAGGNGLNITVPFKERAFALATECSDQATLAKAVNTLFLDQQNILCGDNTDGIGLVTDISINNNFSINDKKILILGAGGAVRGVLAGLISAQPSLVTILNRTASKAEQLKQEFDSYLPVTATSYDDPVEQAFDLVINGTSMSLAGKTPQITAELLAPNCCCYDMMYGKQETPFVTWAKQQGVSLALDGLGMLVEQAAVSFALWRGVRPDTAPILAALRAELSRDV